MAVPILYDFDGSIGGISGALIGQVVVDDGAFAPGALVPIEDFSATFVTGVVFGFGSCAAPAEARVDSAGTDAESLSIQCEVTLNTPVFLDMRLDGTWDLSALDNEGGIQVLGSGPYVLARAGVLPAPGVPLLLLSAVLLVARRP